MKLYWCPQTRAVRAVWMLEEAGVPYERVHINIRDPASKANPAFRAASPMGKVPALETDRLAFGTRARFALLSLRDLARRTADGAIPTLTEVHRMEDEAIIERLTEVRGIGRWTVEMLLMFRLAARTCCPRTLTASARDLRWPSGSGSSRSARTSKSAARCGSLIAPWPAGTCGARRI